MQKKRIDDLAGLVQKRNIDALLVMSPANVYYLTAFASSKLFLLVGPAAGTAVITDFLYHEAVSKVFKGFPVFAAEDSFSDALSRAAAKQRIKKLGFEPSSMTFDVMLSIKRRLKNVKLAPAGDLTESLRNIKDAGEVAAIKNACSITLRAISSVKKRLQPEITEKMACRMIKAAMLKSGADGFAFEPIVATQPHSSQPHYNPTDRRLGSNKAVLIDTGAVLDGYNSDLTSMHLLGKISAKFIHIYDIVKEAQRRAIKKIKPGVRISDVDSAARSFIARKGYDKYFGHALGHGIGLQVHERPSISANNNHVLKEGMVFTVEPGIYLPGIGGVRVEDIVCVTKKGCEVLTDDGGKSA